MIRFNGHEVFKTIKIGDTWMVGNKEFKCVKKGKGRVYFDFPDEFKKVEETSFQEKDFIVNFDNGLWHTYEKEMSVLDWKNRVRKLEEIVAHLSYLITTDYNRIGKANKNEQ
jgi:hypothetical protein